ncbi:MAG: dihydropteroate synthase [Gammaproteobacteria bacterium]|nr:dihydropteroate synthase [Gammaproteobacteria bacterium]
MGILNVTPDSFSDGGEFVTPALALARAREMVAAGADIIDIGGESTRPGARKISADEELSRVMPVIEAICNDTDIPISIDTTKAGVMRAAVAAGVSMINDVTALQGPDALKTAATCKVPVVLMHMQGVPRTMQTRPEYTDVVTEVREFLVKRVAACVAAGIPEHQIIIDPGFGFGKKIEHNLRLFNALQEFTDVQPVLVGVSRKSMIGTVLDKTANERLHGSVALAALATWMHAAIIRVHDVAETVDAVRMIRAVRDVGYTAAAQET